MARIHCQRIFTFEHNIGKLVMKSGVPSLWDCGDFDLSTCGMGWYHSLHMHDLQLQFTLSPVPPPPDFYLCPSSLQLLEVFITLLPPPHLLRKVSLPLQNSLDSPVSNIPTSTLLTWGACSWQSLWPHSLPSHPWLCFAPSCIFTLYQIFNWSFVISSSPSSRNLVLSSPWKKLFLLLCLLLAIPPLLVKLLATGVYTCISTSSPPPLLPECCVVSCFLTEAVLAKPQMTSALEDSVTSL